MGLTPYVHWIVFLHVVGAFVFVAAHAVSMYVVFQVRLEHDPARIASLLDLSARTLGAASLGLLVVLISGIVAGPVLGSFGRGWIWVARVGPRDRHPDESDWRDVHASPPRRRRRAGPCAEARGGRPPSAERRGLLVELLATRRLEASLLRLAAQWSFYAPS